ncbi:endonuclease [Desulfurococcaceae archaeon MEX13E-LK6-19]|nr:endonuclease [Desulfurococcaceae archaeon MEX13E-LK6-19]
MRKIIFDEKTCQGIVYNKDDIEVLDKRWFGRREGDKLILSLEETAYLLLKGEIVIDLGTSELSSLEELMRKYSSCFEKMFWPKLIVYNDLRSRGRRVRVLDEKRFLVKHKDGSLKLLLILEEKSLTSINDIISYVEQARRNNLELALAIVSLQGDITYYTVSSIELVRG